MNMSLGRVKRLLPDSEYQVVADVVRADSLPPQEIQRLRGLVRGWRDKYVQRAQRQAREARGKGKPRATRGSESNENTMRQADIMDWVMDRLTELEGRGGEAGEAPQEDGRKERAAAPVPSRDEVRKTIGEPHVSTFGDLWAEFPDAPVEKIRKVLWALVEAGEVELDTAGGIALTDEDQVAFVEEVQTIDGVPVKRREKAVRHPKGHQERLARTKVVRIRAHGSSRTRRRQAKRDRRGKG